MGLNANGSAKPAAGDGRLRSWKEIASYFGADERTVKRWEVTRGLPVHRVPGEARAPVYAYEAELAAWLRPEAEVAAPGPETASDVAPAVGGARRWRGLVVPGVVVLAVLGLVSVQGWRQADAQRQVADDRVSDVRQLARSQVAALSDRLEQQPGTVRLRAGLAQEAATVLARVAALPDATPDLRQEAAEAYRRLAIVQNSTERPSLRDRPAARASLEKALALVAEDQSPGGRHLRARILIDSARQAAADGAVALAPALLKAASEAAPDAPPALRADMLLGEADIANWQGDYGRAIALGRQVASGKPGDAEAALRQLRGLDAAAEGLYYGGDRTAALAAYRSAAAAAEAGVARWPDEPRFRWVLLRNQWNLGTTLVDAGLAAEALPMLRDSRNGWMAMAKSDPEDGAVASWVRIAQLAYGQGLAAAGQTGPAIAELATSVAERRVWLADNPGNAERQRALVIGLQAMADVFGLAGRTAEACALLAESDGMMLRMARSGGLTQLDRDSMVPLRNETAAAYCPSAAPVLRL
jgi:serine/threonine-protein kinase